ncbi:rhamnogalacturonan acetylesterase [Limibacter armeniacum]|uniref:rhamnogalacturonan acetylesterase n=1 Tax=Limibacter armeniacum TaxID=466084 RepID=UPI002FE63826
MRTLSIIFLLFVCVGCKKELKPITIYMVGDSTMADKQPNKAPETGWGQVFPQFVNEYVAIKNQAVNGRSSKSFLGESRWQPVVDSLQVGDYVFIQFGHNDQKKDSLRYTSLDEYRANLKKYVEETREKGANPILFTSVMRRRFDENGKFYDTHGGYPEVVREVAEGLNVPLIDLHQQTEMLITEHGINDSKKLFLILKAGEHDNYPEGKDDNTHFSEYGAVKVAQLAVNSIKGLELPLAQYLKN